MMSKDNVKNLKNKYKENEAWDEIKSVNIYFKIYIIWINYIKL